MNLFLGGKADKIALLESKFQIYEDLSKEMLDKLERAVDKISESNQQVALILQKHESRLDQTDRSNEAIMEYVRELKSKIDRVDSKVDEIVKFRWIVVGIAVAAGFVVQSSHLFSKFFENSSQSSLTGRIEHVRMT